MQNLQLIVFQIDKLQIISIQESARFDILNILTAQPKLFHIRKFVENLRGNRIN